MIRLIALDLDNTLLMEDNSIPDGLCRQLARCAEKGIEVLIASGRIFPVSCRYARQIGSLYPVIAYNGGIVETQDGEVLFSCEIPEESRKAMVRYCRENDLYLQLYDPLSGDKICVARRRPEILGSRYQLPAEMYREYGNLEKADVRTPKMVIYSDADRLSRAVPEMEALFGGTLSFSFSDSRILEIMPRGAHKGKALEEYCILRGIAPEEVMACGDNRNDLEMIRFAGAGVCVANGAEEVKKAAAYVTKAERSFGVWEALVHFGLAEKE